MGGVDVNMTESDLKGLYICGEMAQMEFMVQIDWVVTLYLKDVYLGNLQGNKAKDFSKSLICIIDIIPKKILK